MAWLFGQCAFALSVLSRMYSARGGDTLRVGPATCEFARTGRVAQANAHAASGTPGCFVLVYHGWTCDEYRMDTK